MLDRHFAKIFVVVFTGWVLGAVLVADAAEQTPPSGLPDALPALLDDQGQEFDQELAILSRRAHSAALEARAKRLGTAASTDAARSQQALAVKLDYSLLEDLGAGLQAIGGTADEPTGQVLLPVDPTLSCPGFYVLRTHAGVPSESGRFGAELLLRGAGRRTLQGGLNFGGRASTAIRGFSAFSIANPRNEPQVVDVGVTVFMPGRLILERRSSTEGNTTYIDQVIQSGSTSISATVTPGFYVVSFQPTNATSTAYGVSALTSFVDRPGGGFQGGVVVGGLHDPDRAAQGTQSTGWASFCIAEPFDVEVSVLSRPTYGSSGSTGMEFSLSTGDGLVFLDSRNPAAQITNVLRGGPTETDPLAIPVQITGVNATPWATNLDQWLGPWRAPQAIFDQGVYVNHPNFWSNIEGQSSTGTSWENPVPGQSHGILVADLRQVRPISEVSVFQMFGLGKTTHIALAGHPNTGSSPPDALDSGWIPFLERSAVGPGRNYGSYITDPTKFYVDTSTRYVRIAAYNDGALGDLEYIDLKGIKMYSPATQCDVAIDPTERNHAPAQANGQFIVSAASDCQWSAISNTSWITVSTGSSGSGDGLVSYQITANNTGNQRSGTITIGSEIFTIVQARTSCTYTLSTSSRSHGSCTADGSVQLSTQSGCPWSATSSAGWLSVTAGYSGNSSGTVRYSLTANNSTGLRSGTITIGDQVISVSQAASNCPYPQFEPEIVITSESSLIFEHVGQSEILVAEVLRRCDACPVSDLPVSFFSRDSSVASVSPVGQVTAQTSTPSSAVIEVRAGSLRPAIATAIIVRYTSDVVDIPTSDIIDFDSESGQLRLERNSLTQSIKPGDVLISNDGGGLLDKVISVTEQGSVIVIATEPASLVDVFDELDVSVVGPPTLFEAIIEDNQVFLLNRFGELLETAQFGPCKLETDVDVNINISGPSIRPKFEVTPMVELKITRAGLIRSRVDHFNLVMDIESSVDVSTGSIEIPGGIEGKIVCERKFTTQGLPLLSFWGVGLGPSMTPLIGIMFEAKAGATVSVTGPSMSEGLDATMGVIYTHDAGWNKIGEYQRTGTGLEWTGWDGNLEMEFEARVEPYAGADFNVSALVVRRSFYDFGLAKFTFLGGAEIKMKSPFDWRQFDYIGPEWRFYVGAYGGLDPLFEKLQVFDSFLERIGIDKFDDRDPQLFKPTHPLLESPKPEVTIGSDQIGADQEIELGVKKAFDSNVEFVAYLQDDQGGYAPGEEVASVQTGNQGTGSAVWKPGLDDIGKYSVRAMAYQGVFGAVGFPYPSVEAKPLEVGAEIVLVIDPSELLQGRVAQQYEFELIASGIPESIEQVRFEWSFGVGSPGSREVSVESGQARTTITQVYEAAGNFTLNASVRHGPEILATASADIVIEGVILTISPPGLSDGEVGVEYEFEFKATGLSDEMGEVLITWSFGDGTAGTGQFSVPVSGGQASIVQSHTYSTVGGYGLYVDVSHAGTILAQQTVSVIIGEVDEGDEVLDACDQWSALKTGSQGVTVDVWDISDIPEGSVFDIYFNARSVPDKFVIDYEGSVVLDTGWRGSSFQYSQNPQLYPGGLSGPGSGSVFDFFRKRGSNTFRMTVYGPDQSTLWDYRVRCRAACDVDLEPTNRLHSALAESGSISVMAESDCEWTATTTANWIQVTSTATGSGDRTVDYSVSENNTGLQRSGVIHIGGSSFLVTQSASDCDYSISPTSRDHGGGNETGTVEVSAENQCSWTASSNSNWISVTEGASGNGDGVVTYSIDANGGSDPRNGSLTIGGQTFTVNQVACESSISPITRVHGPDQESGSVNVTADTECDWTASSGVSWMNVTSGSPGSGDGVVEYSVAENPGSTERTGTMTIAGHAFTVEQQGSACSYSISPTSRTHGPGGESDTVWVTTNPGCNWTAVSNTSWISIEWGETGSGDDTVRYFVSANTGQGQRTGTLTIAEHSFSVTQRAVVTDNSITGRVVKSGESEQNVEIELFRLSDGTWSVVDSTTSGSDGYFVFTGVSALSAGQAYVVGYSNGHGANIPPDDSRLGFWQTYRIEAFSSGTALILKPFEIANVELLDPPPGATVSLPRTFTWTPRAHQAQGGDDYEFNLYENQENWWWTEPLGYSGSYQLTQRPSGFVVGQQYSWFIWIYGDEGQGQSWMNPVTFQ